MISPLREDLIFTKLRENKTHAKISESTVFEIRGHADNTFHAYILYLFFNLYIILRGLLI